MAVQSGLCWTLSETLIVVFLICRLFITLVILKAQGNNTLIPGIKNNADYVTTIDMKKTSQDFVTPAAAFSY